MRPTDSAWAEPLGTFALIALAALLGGVWHVVKHRRAVRRRRQVRARALATRPEVVDLAGRIDAFACPVQCGDPTCPYRTVVEVHRRPGA